MSIGELRSLYENAEIIINPDFQRHFRWTNIQKSKFIESLFLGIPVPNIIIYQREDGIWEVVDGLQRISTILQFLGALREYEPLKIQNLKIITELNNFVWNDTTTDKDDETNRSIPFLLQLWLKRTKLIFTVIEKKHGENAKYELFQRINTGGTFANQQEVRNCIIAMRNKKIHKLIKTLSNDTNFLKTIYINEQLKNAQYNNELILRYFALKEFSGKLIIDNEEFLNETMELLLKNADTINYDIEIKKFETIFKFLAELSNKNIFRELKNNSYGHKFSDIIFDTIIFGILQNIDNFNDYKELLKSKINELWNQENFTNLFKIDKQCKIPAIYNFSKKYFSNE